MSSRLTVRLLLLAALLTPAGAHAHVGSAIGVDAQGRVYFVDTYRNVLWRVNKDGSRTALLRNIHTNAIAVMPDGTVYLPVDDFGATFRWRVTIVAPSGATRDTVLATTIAVDGGHTLGADTGGVYFARPHEVSQVRFDGTMRTRLYNLPIGMDIYAVAPTQLDQVAAISGNTIQRSEADTLGPDIVGDSTPGFADMGRRSARFDRPIALASDARGGVFVADYGNRRVRHVSPSGAATTTMRSEWPWRPTGLALAGDTVYVLERATPYWGFGPIPNFLADMLGTPRVSRVLPNGHVDVVLWMVNWWTWATSTVIVGAVLGWWISRARSVKREARGVTPIEGG